MCVRVHEPKSLVTFLLGFVHGLCTIYVQFSMCDVQRRDAQYIGDHLFYNFFLFNSNLNIKFP